MYCIKINFFIFFFIKALKTLGTVILVFMICWSPYTLHYTFCADISFICPKLLYESIWVQHIIFWVGYFNSMINPFLYNFTNQDFRKAFRDLLHIKKNRKKMSNESSAGSLTNGVGGNTSGTSGTIRSKRTWNETRFL
jgi:hypothetical protein